MADVELDETISSKLKASFKVTDDDIKSTLSFFNGTLKPALKAHYLSHLVTSIEEMINESRTIQCGYRDACQSRQGKAGKDVLHHPCPDKQSRSKSKGI